MGTFREPSYRHLSTYDWATRELLYPTRKRLRLLLCERLKTRTRTTQSHPVPYTRPVWRISPGEGFHHFLEQRIQGSSNHIHTHSLRSALPPVLFPQKEVADATAIGWGRSERIYARDGTSGRSSDAAANVWRKQFYTTAGPSEEREKRWNRLTEKRRH